LGGFQSLRDVNDTMGWQCHLAYIKIKIGSKSASLHGPMTLLPLECHYSTRSPVMASLVKKLQQVASDFGEPSFRHVHGIEGMEEERLKELGYYRGFPCPHNHLIRDSNQHWCYECGRKILSNVCGFDINYLHTDYKHKYAKLWKKVKVTFPEECWEIETPGETTPRRVCLPSYRSGYSKQKSENVNIHKALYQCAWGDVGVLVVTRLCGNPKCGNPLHMASTFNRGYPPKNVTPLELDFKAEKLMLYNRQSHSETGVQPVIRSGYKNVISNPEYLTEETE